MAEVDDDVRVRVERQFLRVVGRIGERDLSVDDARASAPAPRPGSQLAGDDERTTYDPVSFQAHFYLTVAQDHLSTIREVIEVVGHVPPTALYSMARSAIESAAYGVWLLRGGTRAKRVKRSLMLSYDAQRSVSEVYRAAGANYDAAAAYAELESNKRAMKGIEDGADLSSLPTISDILREVDRAVIVEPASALEAWRICSGVTHANRWVVFAVSDSVPVPEQGAERRVEGSSAMLATVLIVAVELRDALRDLLHSLGDHPSPKP